MADYLIKQETVNYGSGSWAVSLYLRVEQVVQSIDYNTTTLRLGLYVSTPSGYSINWGDFGGSYLGVAAYNGGPEQKTTFAQGADGSGIMWLVSDVLATVSHAADGSATAAPIIWKWGVNSPWGQYITPSGTKTVTLPTIPRATTPTLSSYSVTMGDAVTISTPRASSSFTHTLTYSFGGASGTIATGVATSQSWTPPVSLAAQVQNATSGSCTITCATYSGGTLIGAKSVALTLTVPASVVPTISSVSIVEATAGLAAQFGAFVQAKSTLAVAIIASGAQGSTISTYRTTIQDVTYTGSSFTSQVLTASGASFVSVTVTDSRGRTATYSTGLNVLAYFPPKINSMSAWRINTSGTAADEGNRVAVAMSFAIAEVGQRNAHTYSLQYRKESDASFQTLASGSASWTYNNTTLFTSSPEIDPDYPYVIRLTITDYFGSAVAEVALPTAFVVLDFRSTGKGVALGKVSAKDSLEVALPSDFTGAVRVYSPASDQADSGFLRFYRADGSLAAFLATSDGGNGLNLHTYAGGAWAGVIKITSDGKVAPGGVPMTDFVVEQGTSGIWTYRKWNSGAAECWGIISTTTGAFTASGTSGLWVCGDLPTSAYPFTFMAAPVVEISSSGASGWPVLVTAGTPTTSPTFRLLRTYQGASESVALHLSVHGKWK